MRFWFMVHKLLTSTIYCMFLELLLNIFFICIIISSMVTHTFNIIAAYGSIVCSLMLIASLLLRGNALKEQVLQKLQNEASSLFSDLEDELVTNIQGLEGNEIIKEECKQS